MSYLHNVFTEYQRVQKDLQVLLKKEEIDHHQIIQKKEELQALKNQLGMSFVITDPIRIPTDRKRSLFEKLIGSNKYQWLIRIYCAGELHHEIKFNKKDRAQLFQQLIIKHLQEKNNTIVLITGSTK